MKAERKIGFEPIVITLETEEEANMFWHRFNNNGDWSTYKKYENINDTVTYRMWEELNRVHKPKKQTY